MPAASTQNILKNSFWTYLFSYLGAPLSYIARMLISRDISVEELGTLYAILGFLGMLSAYNGLGLTEALKYYIPKLLSEKNTNQIKTTIFLSLMTQLVMSCMIIGGLRFGSGRLANSYFQAPESQEFLKVTCIYFLGSNILHILSALFLSFQDGFSNKLMDFLSIATTLIFVVITYSCDLGSISNYGVSWIIGMGISVIIGLFIYFRKYHPILQQGDIEIKISFLKPFISYSFWTFLGMNSGILLSAIDQQMIIALSGGENAGFYANYLSMINLFSIGITPLVVILVPIFTTLISQHEREKLEHFKTKLYTYMSIFSISLSLILFSLAPQLTQVLYGSDYLPSGDLLRSSVLFYTLNVLTMLNFTLLAGLGRVKAKTLLTIGTGLLNAILNYFLIIRYGNYGALISTIISWFLMAGVSFFLLRKQLPRLDWNMLGSNIILCLLLSWIARGIYHSITGLLGTFSQAILLGVLVVLYYLLIALFNYKEIKNGLHLLFHKDSKAKDFHQQ